LIRQVKKNHADNTNFIAILEKSMIAVNDEYVYELSSVSIKGGEEIAIIPPISGG
jgi:molybdopterin converting factor small subunit